MSQQSSQVSETLNTREETYGGFHNNADTSQKIKAIMHGHMNWLRMKPYQREALDMIAHKMARILNGDPDYKDSWHDIAGYATLAENEGRLK
jgi:hypothetical protein